MKKNILALASVLCVGIVFFQEASAQIESKVVVTVTVKNATPNGKDVSGDDVILRVYHHNQEVGVMEGKADADGKAVFPNVPVMPGFVARGIAKHSNMSFTGPVLELVQGQSAFETEVEVYEISMDNSRLEIGTHQFVIKKMSDKLLLITEYVELVNSTGMAVSSSQKDEAGRNKVITFHLPAGYGNLTMTKYFVKKAIVETADGFYDIMASPPGTHRGAFSYTLEISGDPMEIVKKISMPTKEFVVFSQLGEGNLQGMGAPAGQMTLSDGTPALHYIVSPCEKGREIKLQLKGLAVLKGMSKELLEGDKTNSGLVVMISVLGVVVLVALGRVFLKSPDKDSD